MVKKIIGIEEHWTSAKLAKILKKIPATQRDESLLLNEIGDIQEKLENVGNERIKYMDEHGISMQILSLTPPGTVPLAPTDGINFSKNLNDLIKVSVDKYPNRFRALATLPMSAPKFVAEELERTKSMGFVDAMVYGRSGNLFLDDSMYDDFLLQLKF